MRHRTEPGAQFFKRLIGWKPKHPRIEGTMTRRYCLEMGVWGS